jgi:hypothetical protein
VQELLLVPERLPGFVLQWEGWSPAAGWPLTVELLPGHGDRYRVEGSTLRVAADDGGGLVLHLAGAGEATWQLVEGAGHRVARIALHLPPDAPATLLVDRVAAEERLPSLPALAAVAAHRRRDDLEPDEAPGVRFRTGVTEVDRGVAWGRAALRALFEEGPGGSGLRILDALPERGGAAPPGSEAALLATGALAAGEWEVARAALEREPANGTDAEALALWVAWTSRPEPFVAHMEALERLAPTFPQTLRATLADAAEAAGEEDFAARLRTPAARPAGTGRRLPTVGGASSAAQPAALPAGDPRARYRGGEDEEGFLRLRALLGRLHRDGPDPGALDAAVALDALVRGLLGVAPDAGYGRVTVAPRLPRHWSRLAVEGIRVGDATLGVAMERSDEGVTWRLRQTSGGAPVTWIFEPRVSLETVLGVEVDGESAEVDVVPAGGGHVVKVQLPAERERTVTVRGEEAMGPHSSM